MANKQNLVQHRKIFKKGDVLMNEGESCDGFYLLERGKLDVKVRGKHVGQIDADNGPEFVGEVAALLATPRTATVEATSECMAVWLAVTDLDEVLVTCPSLGVKLARSLAKKLSTSTEAHRQDSFCGEQGKDCACKSKDKHKGKKGDPTLYMLGLAFHMEFAATDCPGTGTTNLLNYFYKTNPWGITQKDVQSPDSSTKKSA